MYYLKLIKGKTYWGIVKASAEKPNVCVPEKEQADFLVKSGFFVLLESPDDGNETPPDSGAEGGNEGEEDLLDFDKDSDGEEGEQPDSFMVDLQKKTKTELSEYAEKNGIDLTGCKTKDDIISKIVEAMARAAAARQAIRVDE